MDGFVNAADYTIWADNFDLPSNSNNRWDQGDFNNDGTVDASDYTIWADNANFSEVPLGDDPEPEPAAVPSLAIQFANAATDKVFRSSSSSSGDQLPGALRGWLALAQLGIKVSWIPDELESRIRPVGNVKRW